MARPPQEWGKIPSKNIPIARHRAAGSGSIFSFAAPGAAGPKMREMAHNYILYHSMARPFAPATRRRCVAAATFFMALATSALAQPLPQRSPWFEIPANATFETGDTWAVDGKRFRLYGVQSCLRQTSFANEHDQKRDCGEASLTMLIALIRDLKPLCYSAATIAGSQTQFVFCFGAVPQGRDKGARVDLGMSLVTLGYGFASLKLDGTPIHQPYLAAQQLAKSSRAGLWAYPDLPEPNAIMLQAARRREPTQPNAALPAPPDR